jgi:hypothetical protein
VFRRRSEPGEPTTEYRTRHTCPLFTTPSPPCHAPTDMRRIALFAALFALVVGCGTSRVTNLTTTRVPRNATGMYPVEFAWDSNQQTMIPGTVKPFVVVGYDFYPMRPSLGISNRWETVVPVGPDKNSLIYHFKVEYDYRTFGKAAHSSKLSPSYKLEIVDK